MRQPVILCVDDEPSVLVSLKEQLKRSFGATYLVETAEDADVALEAYAELMEDKHSVPLVICDQIMPGMKGDELLCRLHAQAPEMMKIMLTGQAGTEAVARAVNDGGLFRFMAKPWLQEDLVLTVRGALQRFEDARMLAEQHATLTEMNAAALDLVAHVASEDRYRRVVRRAANALPADRVALIRVAGERLQVLATCGPVDLPEAFPLDATLRHDLAADVPTPRRDDPLWPDAAASLRIPLRIGEQVVGVLALGSARRGAYDALQRARVDGFATLATAAMNTAHLVDELETALVHRRRIADELLRQANDRVAGPLMGQSHAIRRLRDAISEHASRSRPLLLHGPVGAGSEAAARAMHAESPRADRVFLMVSCAMVQDISAVWAQIELAGDGTLFLAGVNRLPTAVQAALAARLPDLPARVIGSAYGDAAGRSGPAVLHRVLEQAFSHRIEVPPLRTRTSDIPELADFYLRLHAARVGRAVRPLLAEDLARLSAYGWPGNVRELNQVIQRAVLTAQSDVVGIGDALLQATAELGGYRLVDQLAAGGMGEVWRAEHQHLPRPAAVKLIRAMDGGDHAKAVARFKREAAATAALCSPHTVELYDFGLSESGAFFYVMELLRGLDLGTLVQHHGPLPPERAVWLLAQACRSLREAHDQGLVHRDIKPANILTCRLGAEFDFLKVLDFGMVTADADDRAALTNPGALAGTPGYLAPECIQPGEAIDARADIYSLGCVAWWLLTGQRVFNDAAALAMLFAHMQRPVPNLAELAPDAPIELVRLITRCLAKRPADRPASALDVLRALEQVPLETPWTEARAEAWWRLHLPDLCVAPAAPRAPVDVDAPTIG